MGAVEPEGEFIKRGREGVKGGQGATTPWHCGKQLLGRSGREGDKM